MPNLSPWRGICCAGCSVDLLALCVTTLHCTVAEAYFQYYVSWQFGTLREISVEPLVEVCALQFYLLGETQMYFPP